ncbi:hypothetical protein IJ135_02335 [Candidatus Saccharibacteria bacterium]|nr:hypothetical protein [Candidatus Saccharibacteria bacterium]
MSLNPLYLDDDKASPLEQAIHEAEWDDDTRAMLEEWERKKREVINLDEIYGDDMWGDNDCWD